MTVLGDGPCSAGEAARRTGLTVDTLRYYERVGLVPPPARDRAGHRIYTDEDLVWIGMVGCLRSAGLGISDLREFRTRLDDRAGADDLTSFLTAHRAELLARRARLDAALAVLDEKIAHYGPG
ncbi:MULTISPECIES: MerR family transcriptional regulator [Pseudonocardia]|uniref:HTH-type transcriptional regulator AdhR n=2 Tax=Pseudonocardia TaxID=1847 RepID=A0A1Y2MTI7_PSEAH|nr:MULTISPECIES: MerR family transcriptional regulator [Pseudonocardia]OSY37838.1 HTH-type transcriptional regulator AdhR [Pseudonocardia autotrophica]TDN72499.1 DNA-binding transcriptional MerR regulator [Pseudonocardia autotrophica]BBG03208.1 MerR family transcriptional regulator [Pseudonocardia autotrophica]GEC23825.1 MerR family transcriptional regulator [Pseudonocardia saturnea]